MKTGNVKGMLGVCGAALLAGCSAYPGTEADFGNSVRHMVASQTVNPGPVDPSPVETGDGDRLNSVLEAYRSDVSRAETLPPPVVVGFGTTPR
jgi:hypothetical protein